VTSALNLQVCQHGGFARVEDERAWKSVVAELGNDEHDPEKLLSVRDYYLKHLMM